MIHSKIARCHPNFDTFWINRSDQPRGPTAFRSTSHGPFRNSWFLGKFLSKELCCHIHCSDRCLRLVEWCLSQKLWIIIMKNRINCALTIGNRSNHSGWSGKSKKCRHVRAEFYFKSIATHLESVFTYDSILISSFFPIVEKDKLFVWNLLDIDIS